ncbi:MAG: hypothetical protein ACLTQE_00700 [Proteus mirabilis]|uniref:hypothetical protein n=1 Tax=Proteus mirabilis TaxID=584 RepID=UPI0018C454E3|nr:hypothetical protein [Proteus mirabilis]HEJ9413517.1 hypothetical protein [Proteus mirabilis]HEJ9439806.1 hypothetical protein [Proteus mirabilis]HEJ9660378.1 hypothetical protein [Proteus mirabilis]HEK0657731.1 hypothetical protein [Proteus mirabilis]
MKGKYTELFTGSINMKKLGYIKLLSINVMLLAGCNDVSSELTPKNLTKAINKYYQTFCIVPRPAPSNSVKPFPAEIKKGLSGLFISEDEMETKFNNDIKYFNAFVSVNLLDKEVIKNSKDEIIGYRYSPTPEGKKYLENDSSRYICAGNYEVTSIIAINPPIEEAFKEVEVTYTYKAINISPWVNNKVIKETFPQLQQELGTQAENTKTVRLRGNVWTVIN